MADRAGVDAGGVGGEARPDRRDARPGVRPYPGGFARSPQAISSENARAQEKRAPGPLDQPVSCSPRGIDGAITPEPPEERHDPAARPARTTATGHGSVEPDGYGP